MAASDVVVEHGFQEGFAARSVFEAATAAHVTPRQVLRAIHDCIGPSDHVVGVEPSAAEGVGGFVGLRLKLAAKHARPMAASTLERRVLVAPGDPPVCVSAASHDG